MEDNPGQRLKLFRNDRGLSQRELAATLGVQQRSISDGENGRPSPSLIDALFSKMGVSSDWLLHGEGEMIHKPAPFKVTKQILNPMRTDEQRREFGRKRREAHSKVDVEAFSMIGSFEITTSSGPGLVVVSQDTEDQMAFTKAFLARHSVDPEMAGLIRAKDDSMEPFAPNGSRALVDFSARDKFSEGPHIFRYNGSVQVRHLLPLGGGADQALQQVVVIGANPNTSTVIKGAALDDLEIIGRVITVISDI